MKPIAISTGDPGGVGPEIALQALRSGDAADCSVVYGDAAWLEVRARALGLAARTRVIARGQEAAVQPGQIGLIDAGVPWTDEALRHEPTAAGGRAQVAALDAALEAALAGRARALCTAPMSKKAAHLGGRDDFVGHTEHLARAAGLPDDGVTMLFLGPRLRVALATTHLAVRDLSAAITIERVLRTIRHLTQALLRMHAGGGAMRIAVTGLNPHAGESGLFGDEEPRAIAPAIERARREAPFVDGGAVLEGPLGAETALRWAASGEVYGVVVMTHDQGTVASKLLDWGEAVNVTWGLPFVRTSVDHGVAYDAAARGSADAQGMIAALRMARVLAPA